LFTGAPVFSSDFSGTTALGFANTFPLILKVTEAFFALE
jgi:hypothetical protein